MFWCRHQFSCKKMLVGTTVVISFVIVGCGHSGPSHQVVDQMLFTDHPGSLRDDFDGIKGTVFVASEDAVLLVTHLGYYDATGDGLQMSHKVGLFEFPTEKAKTAKLLVVTTVSYGKHAPYDGGYRWVALDNPIRLESGKRYIIAAQNISRVGDRWPDRLLPKNVAPPEGRKFRDALPIWNEMYVGTQPEESRYPCFGTSWDKFPDTLRKDHPDSAYGAGNLGYRAAGPTVASTSPEVPQ
jgi:hypothetical protein